MDESRAVVLVVDADRDGRRATTEAFEDTPFEVAVGADAGEALAAVDGRPVDCVVATHRDGGVDAVALLESVRDANPDLPVVIYAVDGSEAVAAEAIGLGATDYVRPTGDDRGALREAVSVALERRHVEHIYGGFERMVESFQDGVYVTGPDGRFRYVNEAFAELTGYDVDRLVGSRPSLVKSEATTQRITRELRRILRADEPDHVLMEVDIQRADGTSVVCEDHMSYVTGPDGEYRGAAGVVRDVSDRKERERTIRRQRDRLEDFTRIVSHDLRAPLCNARAEVDFARREDADRERHLDNAVSALEHGTELVGKLRRLAKSGETVSDPRPVAFEDVALAAWGEARADGAEFEVEDGLGLLADRTRLRELLANLFENAVEHGGGSVTVRTGPLADAEGFYVEDDGPGIDPDRREAVFDRGFTTAGDGTGLGLAIVEEIAAAHGWSVVATEPRDGSGARFEVTGVETTAEPLECP